MEKKEKNSKARKVLRVVTDIFLFIVVALALFVLAISLTTKKDSDGAATVFGYQLRFVLSDSMAKCDETDVSGFEIKSIPVKSCVFVKVVPDGEAEREEWYRSLKEGDVLTFKYVYTRQETITHRIVEIEEKATGGRIITLAGDNKASESGVMKQVIDTSDVDSPNYIVGKVVGQSYVLGLLVYAFKSPVGIVCLVIVPSLIVIAFEIARIVKTVNEDKKEKIQAQRERDRSEIEDLKRQLVLLQQQKDKSGDQTHEEEDI